MCCPVCRSLHIKDPFLLIVKNTGGGGGGGGFR